MRATGGLSPVYGGRMPSRDQGSVAESLRPQLRPCARGLVAQTKAPVIQSRGLVSTGREAGSAYRSSTRVNVKVLDFVKRGGSVLTVGRTVFER